LLVFQSYHFFSVRLVKAHPQVVTHFEIIFACLAIFMRRVYLKTEGLNFSDLGNNLIFRFNYGFEN